jgi:O-acetyl-ADP-ribose deacetylase (regulator of RNase III)
MSYQALYLDIAREKGDAVVNPLSTNKAERSRFTRALLAACHNNELDKLLAERDLQVGNLFVTKGYSCGFSFILHVVCPFEQDDPALNLLRFTYVTLLNEIKAQGWQKIVIPLLGVDTNGYTVEQSFVAATHVLGDFAARNPKMSLTLAVPAPGDANERQMAIFVKKVVRPVNVVIDESKVYSYWDYFLAYIEGRNRSGVPIDDIKDENDLSHALRSYFVSSSTMAHWKGSQKSKDKQSAYYPVPGKPVLLMIVLLLDMSYEEAKNCFFFCGYGLSPFNKIDAFYLNILQNPRDDIEGINNQLIEHFGPEQSFWPAML